MLERNSSGSPQDLLVRTCARLCKDLLEDVSQIFTRSSHKDLYKITQGPVTGFYQDLHNIFPQGFPQDLVGQDLHMSLGNSRKVGVEGTKSGTTVLREPLQSPLCARIYRKNAAPQEATNTWPEPAQSKCTWTCHNKNNSRREFTGKNAAPQKLSARFVRARAIETHHKSDFSQEFTQKMPPPKVAPQTLREPAQTTCTWSTLIKHRPLLLP